MQTQPITGIPSRKRHSRSPAYRVTFDSTADMMKAAAQFRGCHVATVNPDLGDPRPLFAYDRELIVADSIEDLARELLQFDLAQLKFGPIAPIQNPLCPEQPPVTASWQWVYPDIGHLWPMDLITLSPDLSHEQVKELIFKMALNELDSIAAAYSPEDIEKLVSLSVRDVLETAKHRHG